MDVFEEYEEKLMRVGFSLNEARVYLSLIKLGSSKVGNISKYAHLDRGSVYNSLRSLLEKGLCSYVTIGKTKWFQCSSSNNIITYLSNKVEHAKEFLPRLEYMRKETKLQENVTLFKGNKGVKTVFEDILEHAEENLIFGSEGLFSQRMPLFAKQFTKKQENKGIKIKSIIRINRDEEPGLRKSNVRTIPATTPSPVVTNIYAHKIAIIIWSEVPEAILIENKKAADAYRDYFHFMWKSAQK